MYNVGGKVKIRSWKSLENEFESLFGNIFMKEIVFAHQMKCYCDNIEVISQVIVDDSGATRYLIEGVGGWRFTDQMFDLNYRGGGDDRGI